MNFANGQESYYHIIIIVMNLNEQHHTRIENRDGDVREKIVYSKNAHEAFLKGFYSGAYVGWTVKHFFYCPQRDLYGIILKFANQ